PEIAKIWREGCIIRSAMLNDMADALAEDPSRNLMLAPFFSAKLGETHDALRKVVAEGALKGLPVPALSAALSYFDIMRTERSTANMLQGQRDFFGAHGFERTDKDGSGYHGPWAMNASSAGRVPRMPAKLASVAMNKLKRKGRSDPAFSRLKNGQTALDLT
ncbi:MAG: hypothetical protein ABJN42_31735, partial [Roseibium sp.]